MNLTITGHRIQKLDNYNLCWIKNAIWEIVHDLSINKGNFIQGFSGMASGVDLWFCDILLDFECPYVACIPFKEQAETMDAEDAKHREILIKKASKIMEVRNNWMVEKADRGIVVWDGNKGGTHNVLQQFVEKKTSFHWINPVAQKIWNCL